MFRIAMVCDFFYPKVGGVESHIYCLAKALLSRGHKVVVITHSYADRVGIRLMANCLKVYYLPIVPFYKDSTFITMITSLPFVHRIIRKEEIDIVHCHSTFSQLSHEASFVAGLVGIRTVFTEHSLFGLADPTAVFTNRLVQQSCTVVDNFICVSHTSKENIVVRSNIDPSNVFVIPNAVDNDHFHPDYKRIRPFNKVVVVVGCRMVYRKGIDLLVMVIPRLCNMVFSNGITVDFIIAGDGPERVLLETTIQENDLRDRVTMLGELSSYEVREKLLIKGDIFLNVSLTEAFCMAVVEAASCGLLVVSTKAGAVEEVLPKPIIQIVEPEDKSIEDGVARAVEQVISNHHPNKHVVHSFVKASYSWVKTAERTEKVYTLTTLKAGESLEKKVRNLWEVGPIFGPIMAVVYLLCHYLIIILNNIFD